MSPVTFVSLGPGDPELITCKGLRALQEADFIFYPSTQTKDGTFSTSRSADILKKLGISAEHLIRFDLPMSKIRTQAIDKYHQICLKASQLSEQDKKVCIVAEGDAGFYSSIQTILEKLRLSGTPVRRIAGVPAFIAAAASIGLNIANQDERIIVMPGNVSAEEIEKYMSEKTTVIIMKLSQCAVEVQRCIELHPHYKYHYFENVGTENETYHNKPEVIKSLQYPYFSLLIVRYKDL